MRILSGDEYRKSTKSILFFLGIFIFILGFTLQVSANDARLVSGSYGSVKSDVDFTGFGVYVIVLLVCYIVFRVVLQVMKNNLKKNQNPDSIAYAETESSNYNLEKDVIENAFGHYDASQEEQNHFESRIDKLLDEEMIRKPK